MRKYRVRATSDERIEYAIELMEGLKQFPETAPLANAIAGPNEQLDAIRGERDRKERELLVLRVRLRFADYNWDLTARGGWRALEIIDGAPQGKLQKSVYPDGVASVVSAAGSGQVPIAKAFIEHVKASKAAGLDPWRAEWLPKLEAAYIALDKANKARQEGYEAVTAVRVREEAAKEDHELLVEKIMGQVRATFPKDRKRWDLIFPQGWGPAAPAEEEPALPVPTPGGSPTPGPGPTS